MARGQDAPIGVGAQIDPYVQQSLTQGKQQANDRLIAAMQQAGARERAEISSATQIQTQASQSSAQRDVSAAQQAGADRRAAEGEQGRREDQEFSKFMVGERQRFDTERDSLVREQTLADKEDRREYAEEIQGKIDARDDLADLVARKETRGYRNATLTMLKGSMGREESLEKFKTSAIKTKIEYDQSSSRYSELVSDTVSEFADDPQLKLSIKGEFRTVARPAGSSMGFSAGFTGVQEAVPDTKANPQAALQKQLTRSGVSFSAEVTTPEKIHELEDQIIEGKATVEDIRSFLGVVEGGIDYWRAREDAVGASKEEKDFSYKNRRDLQAQQRAVIGLKSRTNKKIKTSDNFTVGTIISDALGPTNRKYAPSFGKDLAEFQLKSGTDYSALFEEVTRAFNPEDPLDIPEGSSPELITLIMEENEKIKSIFSVE